MGERSEWGIEEEKMKGDWGGASERGLRREWEDRDEGKGEKFKEGGEGQREGNRKKRRHWEINRKKGKK